LIEVFDGLEVAVNIVSLAFSWRVAIPGNANIFAGV
jgi:hypothetical protein